jgi:signal transduction histidine kinase
MSTHLLTTKRLLYVVVSVLIGVALYITSRYSYLLFHSVVEEFSILVAFGVFLLGWYSIKYTENRAFLLLGVAFLFIGWIDFFHTLAYPGMGVFPGSDTNLAAQLWITARYLESITLLLAPLAIRRSLNRTYVAAAYSVISGLLLSTIFVWHVFPVCFIEGVGLTPFKIISEYIISAILAMSGFLFYNRRSQFYSSTIRFLIIAVSFTIASELAFTLYTDAFGITNVVGHYLKVIAFYFLYQALVQASLVRPYDTLFKDLKQSREMEAARAAQLEALNRELESFSYSVSHDLRAPLRALDGFSSALEKNYADRLDDNGKHYLDRIRAGSQRMSNLIDTLLQLSRLSRNELRRSTVNLTSMVREILDTLQQKSPERPVEVVIADGMTVNADEHLLYIVMTNLLENAWKFTGSHSRARIEIGKVTQEGREVFYVRDDGVGFDMKYSDKIFAPFQRFHSLEEFEGSGIGLATVQRIISRHGGQIWAQAAPEQGATFYFTLGLEVSSINP